MIQHWVNTDLTLSQMLVICCLLWPTFGPMLIIFYAPWPAVWPISEDDKCGIVGKICGTNVGPISKITLGQHHLPTMGQCN